MAYTDLLRTNEGLPYVPYLTDMTEEMYDKITDCMAAEVAKRMFAALKSKIDYIRYAR